MLDSAVRKAGDKEAVVYRDRRLTYRELAAAVRRTARVLRDAGLQPGDRLAVMTYNTPSSRSSAGRTRSGARPSSPWSYCATAQN
ncbi:AMP-binding protein [Streptomyces sp. Ncost-T10-10d]|uniref:AMP-binding protein n=1 Tax=Streptomyces sp. Ncost-T10-10d TaxID=1839774 RepID=UPI00210B55C7|nr:AMP-binding protein [Streptomyces sp. Ncost-T10-10d]